MTHVFTDEQILDLDKKLDPLQVKQRKGSNGMLSYIEGHTAIDQSNRLFGYGNWAFRTLSCEQAILLDPSTGESVGVAYKAQVELIVRDCVGPIVEVGSQPVAAWNVRDVVMARRGKNANREKPIEEWEKVAAQRTIVEAHENAEKSAVTDAMKRALRSYGNQFGNGLYGDGKIDLPETPEQEDGQGTETQNAPRPTLVVSPPSVKELQKRCTQLFGSGQWGSLLTRLFGEIIPDDNLTPEDQDKIDRSFKNVEQKRAAKQSA